MCDKLSLIIKNKHWISPFYQRIKIEVYIVFTSLVFWHLRFLVVLKVFNFQFDIYTKKRMRFILITSIILTIYLGKCTSYTAFMEAKTTKSSLWLTCSAHFVDNSVDKLVNLIVSKDDKVFYQYDYKKEPGNLDTR